MNENQGTTYKTEKGELYSQVMQYEKEFDKSNFRYRLGGFIKRNGIRGFWAPYDLENFFLILFNIFLKFIFMVIILCVCQDFVISLIVYAIPHIALIIAGTIVESNAFKKLKSLEAAVEEKYNMYAERQYEQYCITDRNSVVFDNGLQVENGQISFPLCRDFGNIKIYQLAKQEDKETYKQIKDEVSYGNTDIILFNKHIASVQFTKNFGVITNKDNVMQTLGYLSPTVQINMINHINELKNYTRIHAYNGIMNLGTNRYVNPPERFNVLDKYSSVIRYFDEIDRHCQDLLRMGFTALNELQQLEFLKGNF